MNILCNTNEELKKILGRLGKDGCKWHNKAQLVKWGLENVYAPVVIIVDDKEVVYDNDIYDYAQFVTADKFFAANPEKEGEPMPEILVDKAVYDKAVKAVVETLEELAKSEELNEPAQFLVPLVGAIFAKKVRARLFKEDTQNGSK